MKKEFIETVQILVAVIVACIIIFGSVIFTVFAVNKINAPYVYISNSFTLKDGNNNFTCQILQSESNTFILKCLEAEGE